MDSIENKQKKTTHFGYQTISESEKEAKVGEVFHSVADSYDIMNDLMSFGVHRLWKRFTIDWMKIRPGQQVLDLAGGTGDLALKIAPIGDGLYCLKKSGIVILTSPIIILAFFNFLFNFSLSIL